MLSEENARHPFLSYSFFCKVSYVFSASFLVCSIFLINFCLSLVCTPIWRRKLTLFAYLFVADDEPRRDECCGGGDGGCGAVWSPYRLRQGTSRPTTTTPGTPDVGREYRHENEQ